MIHCGKPVVVVSSIREQWTDVLGAAAPCGMIYVISFAVMESFMPKTPKNMSVVGKRHFTLIQKPVVAKKFSPRKGCVVVNMLSLIQSMKSAAMRNLCLKVLPRR